MEKAVRQKLNITASVAKKKIKKEKHLKRSTANQKKKMSKSKVRMYEKQVYFGRYTHERTKCDVLLWFWEAKRDTTTIASNSNNYANNQKQRKRLEQVTAEQKQNPAQYVCVMCLRMCVWVVKW